EPHDCSIGGHRIRRIPMALFAIFGCKGKISEGNSSIDLSKQELASRTIGRLRCRPNTRFPYRGNNLHLSTIAHRESTEKYMKGCSWNKKSVKIPAAPPEIIASG